jgi:hypothetical protein
MPTINDLRKMIRETLEEKKSEKALREFIKNLVSEETLAHEVEDGLNEKEEGLKGACWKGYEAIGFKNKNGRRVPNCVPKKEAALRRGRLIRESSTCNQCGAVHMEEMDTCNECGYMDEVAPPGKERMVKALKKDPDIDNPWAVAWAHKKKYG